MASVKHFRKLLSRIDSLLAKYDPGKPQPKTIVRDIFRMRSRQAPLLERVVKATTGGLRRYPFNAELLKRRAFARARIVTHDMKYPEAEKAEQDLQTILEVDPDCLAGACELLDLMFTFSAIDDNRVAGIAAEFAKRAADTLLDLVCLQIRALAYARRPSQAARLYARWSKVFPNSTCMRHAGRDVATFTRRPARAKNRHM